MANIKSSAKRDEKSKELRAKNRAEKTELKTMIKKFDAAVADGNRDAVTMPSVPIKLPLRLLTARPVRVCCIRIMRRTKSPRWISSSTLWSKALNAN